MINQSIHCNTTVHSNKSMVYHLNNDVIPPLESDIDDIWLYNTTNQPVTTFVPVIQSISMNDTQTVTIQITNPSNTDTLQRDNDESVTIDCRINTDQQGECSVHILPDAPLYTPQQSVSSQHNTPIELDNANLNNNTSGVAVELNDIVHGDSFDITASDCGHSALQQLQHGIVEAIDNSSHNVNSNISNISTTINDIKQCITILTAQVQQSSCYKDYKDTMHQNYQLQIESTNNQTLINELQGRIDQYGMTESLLTHDSTILQQSNTKLTDDIAQRDKIIQQMQNDITELYNANKEAEQYVTRQEQQLQHANQTIQQLQNNTVCGSTGSTTSQLSNASASGDQATSLKHATLLIDKLTSEQQSTHNECIQWRNQYNQSQQQITQLKQLYDSQKEKLELSQYKIDNELKQAQDNLIDATCRIDLLQTEKISLQSQLNEFQQQTLIIARLQNDNRQLQSDCASKQESIDLYISSLNDTKSELKQLQIRFDAYLQTHHNPSTSYKPIDHSNTYNPSNNNTTDSQAATRSLSHTQSTRINATVNKPVKLVKHPIDLTLSSKFDPETNLLCHSISAPGDQFEGIDEFDDDERIIHKKQRLVKLELVCSVIYTNTIIYNCMHLTSPLSFQCNDYTD